MNDHTTPLVIFIRYGPHKALHSEKRCNKLIAGKNFKEGIGMVSEC
jgi:hypothetical protein